jgi:hypothetical protein
MTGQFSVSSRRNLLARGGLLLLMLAWLTSTVGVSAGFREAGGIAQDSAWKIECVDCPRRIGGMAEHSLRVDADGYPHLAYGYDHLYYAWSDGTSWYSDTVDVDDKGAFSTSLALDSSGNAHISYSGWANGNLKFAHLEAGVWTVETIDIGSGGGTTSLALDSVNQPHIAYSSSAGGLDFHGDLRYAYQEAGQWYTETVDTDANISTGTLSMGLDGAGYPHIIYYHLDSWISGSMKYAYQDAGGWHFQDFNTTVDVARYASLVIDDQGYAHVGYIDPTNSELNYAYQDASQWYTETVDVSCTLGLDPALQLAGDGSPYISYIIRVGGQHSVKMAYHDDTGWHIELIHSGKNNIGMPSIDLDADGKAYVTFNDAGAYELMVAHRETAGWQVEVVDRSGEVGQYISMALDGNNRAHIGYYDVQNQDLKYAYQDDLGWHIEMADNSGQVGRNPSLDLDANGYPHVSYYDMGNYELKYAYRDGTGWHPMDLADFGPGTGLVRSGIKIDPGGYPHIVCVANNQDNIYHFYQDSTGWQYEVVTTGTSIYISMDIDLEGHLHFSYMDGGLQYAYQDGTGWNFETVDNTSPDAGMMNSIALDINSNPRISYFGSWSQLRFAYRDGTGWHYEDVDQVGSSTPASSLALDQNGFPHIAYADLDIGEMRYAYQDAAGWHIQILDGHGAGFGSSIALDSNDSPYVAYSGQGDSQLFLATLAPLLNEFIYLPLIRR